MTYVLDCSSFIVMGHYFSEQFPSFWTRLDELVALGRIVSVREVLRELEVSATAPHLLEWVSNNRGIFLLPTPAETEFVSTILTVRHFQQLVSLRQRMKGGPAADPFVIASAQVRGGCVVTQEKLKPNAAKIPNVCARFGIDCTDLQGLMAREGWVF